MRRHAAPRSLPAPRTGLALSLSVVLSLALASTGCSKSSRAQLYEEQGRYAEAAEIYVELGELEKAAELYAEVGALTRTGELYAEAENWTKAAEAYESINLYAEAAEVYKKAGELEKAGDLLLEDGQSPAAAELFEQAEAWAKLGTALEQQGKFEDAAHAYEKGEDFSGFGRMLEKAGKTLEAAAAYERGNNYRAAATLYEQVEQFEDAARNAAALAKRDNGTDAKLLAARLHAKIDKPEDAAAYYEAAANQAKEFGNFAAVIEISLESGKIQDAMSWSIDHASELLDEGRASEAFDALVALNAIDDQQWSKLKRAEQRRFEALADEVTQAIDKLPEVPKINGHNSFLAYDSGFETFEYSQFEGAVHNKGDAPLARVELEITLFQKDFDSFISGEDGWGSIPEELTKKFEEEQAGYKEVIVLTDIPPGETREFTQKLGNTVPYKYFAHHVIKAEPAG